MYRYSVVDTSGDGVLGVAATIVGANLLDSGSLVAVAVAGGLVAVGDLLDGSVLNVLGLAIAVVLGDGLLNGVLGSLGDWLGDLVVGVLGDGHGVGNLVRGLHFGGLVAVADLLLVG